MSALADKIRRARETGVEVNGRHFVIRRPTDEEFAGLGGSSLLGMAKRFTIGWDLTELDLVPGGTAVPVLFDADDFAEWIADQPEFWVPLGEQVLAAYKAHAAKREQAAKN